MKTKTKAFTLAEVLITLAIIGVVAAITIPSLMQSTQNAENVAKVKKAYSTLSAAYQRAVVDNGSPDGWGWTGDASSIGAQNVLNVLAPYFNITKNCGATAYSGCFLPERYSYLTGALKTAENFESAAVFAKAQLADGTLMVVEPKSSNCNDGTSNRGSTMALHSVCGIVFFDINGKSYPNQYGKDAFLFYITKYGAIPAGTSSETNWLSDDCNKTNGSGYACAAWVVEKGNMDYLK